MKCKRDWAFSFLASNDFAEREVIFFKALIFLKSSEQPWKKYPKSQNYYKLGHEIG